jgi:hypothetical protein
MQHSSSAAGGQVSHSAMALYSSPYRTSRPRIESPQQPHQQPFGYNRSSHYHRYSSPSPPHLPSNNRGNGLPFSTTTHSTTNNALTIKSSNGPSSTTIVQPPPSTPAASIAESKEKQQQQAIAAPIQPITNSAAAAPNESQQDSSQSQEITWLFFRDNKWMPFQSENHYKIEQAFTLGGMTYLIFLLKSRSIDLTHPSTFSSI